MITTTVLPHTPVTDEALICFNTDGVLHNELLRGETGEDLDILALKAYSKWTGTTLIDASTLNVVHPEV